MQFSNWSGLISSEPADITSVGSLADVQQMVARATRDGRRVRVAGTTHSHSPLLANDDGVIVRTESLAGAPVVDQATATATIPGGTKLAAVGDALWDAGLSFENQGDVDVQSVAGLTGTGVHGTGPGLRSISSAVVDATIVAATGDIVQASSDADLLEAARLHLGALGVMVDVTLQLVPAYFLRQRQWRVAPDELMPDIAHHIAATRHFEFFWYPVDDRCYAKSLDPHPGPPDPLDDEPGGCIDRAYRVFPSVRSDRHTEMEYSVPAEVGPACFAEIRALMQGEFSDVTWPVEYRTVAADDRWISPASGRPTVTISVHQGIDAPYEAFFAAAERIFLAHGGRPHWGKFHNRTGADLAADYGAGFAAFVEVQRSLDPAGTFLNDHLTTLLR